MKDTAQLSAIESDSPLLLMVAGAGSGKTSTLKDRVERLIREGAAHPDEILIITFTNQAADEISKRLQAALSDLPQPTAFGYAGTLHGFMLKLIRLHGGTVGLDGKSLAILDKEAREQMIKDVILLTNYKGTRRDLDAEIEKGPRFEKIVGRMDAVQIVASQFYNAMRSAGVIDFDSILFYGLAIVRKQVQSPFRYMFVDEFQDSGDLDFQIYRSLKIENKFYVGDTDQAIYAFRGGNIKNILMLAQAPGVQVVRLESNYRCAESICEAANRLISHNSERIKKDTVSRTGRVGEIDIWPAIPNALTEGARIADDIARNGIESDCAVLVYTNPLARQLTEQLRAKGLEVARRQVYEDPPEWKKAKALINFLANPFSDSTAEKWERILRGEEIALAHKLEARKKMVSINMLSFKLSPGQKLIDVPDCLGMYAIGPEEKTRVLELMLSLPPRSSIADLAMAMTRDLEQPQAGPGVVVTTMHGAKGREWGTVYLPAFEQKIIPGDRAGSTVEEMRRVAYVAITRAKNRLVISHCRERNTQFDFTPKPQEASQFIAEAGLSVISEYPVSKV